VSDLEARQTWLDALKWDAQGMIPAIAQDADSGRVLMFAFMNRQSLQETVDSGTAVYWSRSRQRLWRKGEESGHAQRVRLDPDRLRRRCACCCRSTRWAASPATPAARAVSFYQLQGNFWVAVDPVLKDPKDIYGK
jgi:phosphoribosyl-AMP cyclohydrolase